MSRVLLIDADSIIPNIALMKLSRYHKDLNDSVLCIRLNLPYYPNRKKKHYTVKYSFDKIYCSVVFAGNKDYIHGENIIFGGTGFDLDTRLPDDIENLQCDYKIYPENNISFGFLTRGCIRKCKFCIVWKKEGFIHKVNEIKNIAIHNKVKFLDNNILAYNDHKRILNQLVEMNLNCSFIQGLDIRLLDKENSMLLSKMNYLGDIIFAFDDIRLLNTIQNKLKLLRWRADWKLKFYVYIHPNMSNSSIVRRILFLKSKKILPYIMRDITCWGSLRQDFYTDLAAYCNQVKIFRSMSFIQFLNARHMNNKRICSSTDHWNNSIGKVKRYK